MSRSHQTLDFDAEAHALWKRLNLDPTARQRGRWNPLDSIYKHPRGSGVIYVGNQNAASDINLLRHHGITHVVNCTHGESKIPDYHRGKLHYYNFPISHWPLYVNATNRSVLEFTQPLFQFIGDAISRGESVLIHCLAGAHRAGTTGVACLIHFADMDVPQAIRVAKQCREIIDPIGQLPEFLHRLRHAEYERKHALAAPSHK